MRHPLLRGAIAALMAFMVPATTHATTLKIYPVLIQLDGKTLVQTMTIENSSDALARMQVRVVAWRQDNGQDLFEDTRDILANPPLFEVAAGAQQIARFGLRTTAGTTEKSYRIFLEEIPTERPLAPGEVRTLLRVSIPIFVPALGAQPSLDWQISGTGDKQVMVSVRNTGGAHIHLNRIDIRRADGSALTARQESIYILPGAARSFLLDAPGAIRAGEKLTLDATSDTQRLSVNLVSQAGSHGDGDR
ncbi:fimbria/pilus periplasmic chaperone [Sphingobium sp. WCS2017Hpa-17]|uniref:fimbrial biogenesis chaperone n=1 Tax=Sphingobium sp. WCS2017Hpa-17 TaxID=3073638 RepID=UPI00288BA893|nr:fimbria/pilus periplasmic chaperone [Sphingobium sp. WCS2017Hpa-17]